MSDIEALCDPVDAAVEKEPWHPSRRSILESVTLGLRDWEGILPFFDGPEPDLDIAAAYIEDVYRDYPVILRQCRFSLEAIRSFAAGEPPDISNLRFVNLKPILNFLIMTGQLDVLRALLPLCSAKWDMRRMMEIMTMLMPGEGLLGPLSALDKTWLDWQVFGTGSPTTVILFCGLAGRFGMETNVLFPWLTDLPCNIVLVRDWSNRLYLNGIKSLGKDKASTVETMRAELEKLGTRRLVTAGNSGGVYAALHYGCLLKADQVLCFAGPTTLDSGFENMEDKPIYEAIAREIEQGTLEAPDLLADLAAARLPVRYFHGADNAFDSSQAARLKGIPGASIEPLVGWDGHFVQGELVRRGLFKNIWRDAIGLPPVAGAER